MRQAVLGHLEAGGGDAAGIGGLAGAVEDLLVDEEVHALGDGGHVGALADEVDAVLEEILGVS